jgi:hypothetical protein
MERADARPIAALVERDVVTRGRTPGAAHAAGQDVLFDQCASFDQRLSHH